MKQKTSITLTAELLAEVDRLAGDESRSAFIERILRRHLRRRARAEQHGRDLERLNRAAERLNREAVDVLEYQATWSEE